MFDDFMMNDFGLGQEAAAPSKVPSPMDCMSCGACLSHCPTFHLAQDEQEGPRQRIRTLEKLVLLEQTVDDDAVAHLANCTQCRACEAACPSQMQYGELFDQAQHQLTRDRKKPRFAQLALALIADKSRFRRALPWLSLAHASGLRWLARKTGGLRWLQLEQADRMGRAPTRAPLPATHPAKPPAKGKVALFTGCLSEAFDRETLDAAITVIQALGYEVVVPEQQACCGAMHYHNGEPETAQALMQQNRACFNALEVEAVVHCVSGCGAQLQEYGLALGLDESEPAFTPPLHDICEFIVNHWRPLELQPRPGKVAVHEPCSQRNVLKNQQSVYDLLAKIPELAVEALAENPLCCGAGGGYMLTHEHTAQALRDQTWQQLKDRPVDGVVTTNLGCALHLQTDNAPLKHPVTLLAEQLAAPPLTRP